MENEFRNKDSKNMWRSLRKITGYAPAKERVQVHNERDYANELNTFYCRFDCYDFSKEQQDLRESLEESSNECTFWPVSECEVRAKFKNVKVSKATGPDRIKGKVLRECCDQLTPIFTYLFNMSLKSHMIPLLWKTSEIVPVPKKTHILSLNDLRPVALTSIAFKCFERIVLSRIVTVTSGHLDRFQFAYKEKRNVEDAVLVFINTVLKHLETPRMYARALFIDFSSAFNTIQPHLLIRKLLDLDVDVHIAAWVLDFLTSRPQYVKLNNAISETLKTNTGAPQGSVLSPALYTIYTNDYIKSEAANTIIKFADDSSILGMIHLNEENYFREVDSFVKWCEENFLKVNVNKTMEMIFDFRRTCHTLPQLKIKDETVGITGTYKYLGITIDNKLSWNEHVNSIVKKANQRLYFLRKLKSFQIDSRILETFYSSTIQSIITFGISCYGGNISKQQQVRLDRVIGKASKLVNTPLPSFSDLYTTNIIKVAGKIIADCNHPLNSEYETSARSSRLVSKAAKTNRYKNSFVPASIRALQKSTARVCPLHNT